MAEFKYIPTTYVPSVNLETLGQTFNTLEQGHKEAVKAASDLAIAVSKMEMDSSEDGFKQQLVNDIQDMVAENTLYGNSYGALDELILKAGDMATDGRIQGRVRNHMLKTQYDAKVDAMDIPEGMKQMYKDKNPYYYKDGDIDPKSGKVLPGEKWEAKSNPTKQISDVDLQTYVLKIAQAEEGSLNSVSYLDANGKETPYPSESVDGQIYKQVGGTWKRLSPEKIIKAYKMAIDSIPGAEDSLRQDYEYEKYSYEKLLKENIEKGDNSIPKIQGLTDKNGLIYNYDQWLNNKMTGFADLVKINEVKPTVTYGTALQSKKAREANAASTVSVDGDGIATKGHGTTLIGYEEVKANAFGGAVNAKTAANVQGLNIIKKLGEFKDADSISDVLRNLTNKNLATGPGTAATYFIKKYGDKLSQEDKINLVTSFKSYVSANQQVSQMMKQSGTKADGLRFSQDLNNGIWTDSNKYSKQIIQHINDFYASHNKAVFVIGSTVLTNAAKKYNTDIQGLKKLGFEIIKEDDESYKVYVPSSIKNELPKFVYNLEMADKETEGSVGGWLENKFTTGVDHRNYYIPKFTTVTSRYLLQLARFYENGLEAAEEAEAKLDVNTGTRSLEAVNEGCYDAAWLEENGMRLGYTLEQIRQEKKAANDRLDLAFASGAFDMGEIKEIGEDGMAKINIANNQDIKLLLQKMYSSDSFKNNIKRVIVPPTGNQKGEAQSYAISLVVPKDAATGNYKEGEKYTFVVKGVSMEGRNYDMSLNPKTLADNAIFLSRATNSNIETYGYSEDLGDTTFKPNADGTFSSTFMGVDKKYDVNEVNKLLGLLYTLDSYKADLTAGIYNTSVEHVVAAQEAFDAIAKNISDITGRNIQDVELMISNYVQRPED